MEVANLEVLYSHLLHLLALFNSAESKWGGRGPTFLSSSHTGKHVSHAVVTGMGHQHSMVQELGCLQGTLQDHE